MLTHNCTLARTSIGAIERAPACFIFHRINNSEQAFSHCQFSTQFSHTRVCVCVFECAWHQPGELSFQHRACSSFFTLCSSIRIKSSRRPGKPCAVTQLAWIQDRSKLRVLQRPLPVGSRSSSRSSRKSLVLCVVLPGLSGSGRSGEKSGFFGENSGGNLVHLLWAVFFDEPALDLKVIMSNFPNGEKPTFPSSWAVCRCRAMAFRTSSGKNGVIRFFRGDFPVAVDGARAVFFELCCVMFSFSFSLIHCLKLNKS